MFNLYNKIVNLILKRKDLLIRMKKRYFENVRIGGHTFENNRRMPYANG